MKCPDDGSNLDEVKLKSYYGWDVAIDTCPMCRGMWFDSMELFPVDNREAIRIDTLSRMTEVTDSDGKMCPRCNLPLVDFKDPNIPEDLVMHVCNSCRGLWLYSGVFKEYKTYQENKKAQLMAQLDAESSRKLREQENLTPIERMSKYLMTPYYGSGQTLEMPSKGDIAFSIFKVIIELLLRIR